MLPPLKGVYKIGLGTVHSQSTIQFQFQVYRADRDLEFAIFFIASIKCYEFFLCSKFINEILNINDKQFKMVIIFL